MSNEKAQLYSGHLHNMGKIAVAVRASIAEDDHGIELLASELNQSPSLAKRLFPTELESTQQQITVEQIRSLASKKEQMMDMYFKIKMEMARAEAETLIAATRIDLVTGLTHFVTAKIDEMDSNILDSRSTVMKKMLPHLQEVETYKDFPVLYEPAKKSVSNQISNYMDTIDELLNGFRACLRTYSAEKGDTFSNKKN